MISFLDSSGRRRGCGLLFLAPSWFPLILTAVLLETCLGFMSCGGGNSAPPPPPPVVSVSVSPNPQSVQAGTSQPFSAIVSNSTDQNVTWSLSGPGCTGATCGTLTNVGAASVTYSAPTLVPNPA